MRKSLEKQKNRIPRIPLSEPHKGRYGALSTNMLASLRLLTVRAMKVLISVLGLLAIGTMQLLISL
jgi:hypothetical protein